MLLTPAQWFHLLSDETRLRALLLLHQEGELCVCELTHALGEIQPKISRHLAALREAGVVTDRRQGQWIYYRIRPELPAWATQILHTTHAAAGQLESYRRCCTALADMPNRPHAVCSD